VYRRQAERDVWLPGPNAVGARPGVEIVQVNPKFVQYGVFGAAWLSLTKTIAGAWCQGDYPHSAKMPTIRKIIDLIDKIFFPYYYMNHG
jgi:hypothetical protein